MATNRLKNQFIWDEEIPEIGKKGDLLRDRTFSFTVRGRKTIKISTSFYYDLPEVYYQVKVVQGAEMIASQPRFVELKLDYNLGTNKGQWTINAFDSVHTSIKHPNFDLIFCNANQGKRVTYSLSTILDVLKTEEKPMVVEKCLKLPELIFFEKELSDIKLICERQIFECHKLVLSCQSNVFKAMFMSKSMVESESGKVEIVDFKATTVAKMVYFMYHDNLINKENVDSDLLILAEKYNIRGLMNYCVKYFEENLSLENALDVLVSSHLTNQKRLFDAATKFAIDNKGLLVKTESWKELLETNPKLANKIAMTMLELE